MKIRKILIEEFIRAIIIWWLVFIILSIFYRGGFFSRKTLLITTFALMAVVFVSFTLIRVRTGHLLMVQGALGWSILLAVIYALDLIFVSIGVVLGQADLIFAHGIWPIIAGVLLTALFAWLGYKSSEKHPPQN